MLFFESYSKSKPGKSKPGLKWSGLAYFTVSLLLSACGVDEKSDAPPPHGASAAAPTAMPVTVTKAIQKTIQPVSEWTGHFESPESVELRSRVSGVIESLHFKAGQRVKKGDVLYTLDSAPFEAELARAAAQVASAKAHVELSRTEALRSKKLFEAKATSQQETDTLRVQQNQAEAALKAAEAAYRLANLNLNYTKIRAPIDGRVSRALITAGNLIGAGTSVLTTVVSVDPMHVYFAMSEQSYLKSSAVLRAGKMVPVKMVLSDEADGKHEGKLDFLDNRVSASTGTVQARAVFENTSGQWMPGLFARVSVPEGEPVEALLVPDRAVNIDQSKKIIWVVSPENKAFSKEVKLGALHEGLRVVHSGLKAGELIIVEGVQRIQPGMLVKAEK